MFVENKRAGLKSAGIMLVAMLTLAGCHKDAAKANPEQPATQATQPTSDAVAQQQAANTLATAPADGQGQPASAAPAPAPNAPPAAAPVPESAPIPPAQANNAPNNAAVQQPAPPPAPVFVSVPRGTPLRIRLDRTIDVKHSHAGDHFGGVIAEPVVVDGSTLIPTGSLARGEILEAHRRGHFKGRSILELTLVGLEVNGHHYSIATRTDVRTKKGKGKRSAAFIGGGAGLGMLVGGVATGGVGLLVGGLAGGGAGTLGAAFTGNRDIKIPAETVMTFRLADPIELR